MGINRNIVECKDPSKYSCFGLDNVLIETLWNVKLIIHAYYMVSKSVLIETLWNVKWYRDSGKTLEKSINRNIVECKDTIKSNHSPSFTSY